MPTAPAARWSFARSARDGPRSCRCGAAPRAFARSSANAARSRSPDSVAKIAAIVSDLMLASRVSESLKAAGHEVSVAATLPDPVEADAIVCDLDTADLDAVVATGLPTLGFYSHVDVNTKQQAEAAGLKLAVPRSRMSRELPQLVDRLLASEA